MNYIRLRKNNLCVENISAQKLTKKYKTPFYCYSLSQLKSNFYNFRNAFRAIKPIICFSIKSNANLTILKELKRLEFDLTEKHIIGFTALNALSSA